MNVSEDTNIRVYKGKYAICRLARMDVQKDRNDLADLTHDSDSDTHTHLPTTSICATLCTGGLSRLKSAKVERPFSRGGLNGSHRCHVAELQTKRLPPSNGVSAAQRPSTSIFSHPANHIKPRVSSHHSEVTGSLRA